MNSLTRATQRLRLLLPRPLTTSSVTPSATSAAEVQSSAAGEQSPQAPPNIREPKWPLDARGMPIKTAKARRLGINVSHRKLNLVGKLVRGNSIREAYRQLSICVKKTAPTVQKTIAAAVKNATLMGLRADRLIVSEAFVGKGRYLVRIRPWHGKGRFGVEHKKYAHLTVIVRELDDELWEDTIESAYIPLKKSGGNRVDDDEHAIHESETICWISDLDRSFLETKESVVGLRAALEQKSSKHTAAPSTDSTNGSDAHPDP